MRPSPVSTRTYTLFPCTTLVRSTINAVGDAVGHLSGDATDPAALVTQLKTGLQAPLTGMGTAFSSSLFGLAGSLVLGFLELQASQAQNRFCNELEDWLSAQTRLSSGGPVGDGDQSEIGRASCRERVCQYV